jgi:hypothetical protein
MLSVVVNVMHLRKTHLLRFDVSDMLKNIVLLVQWGIFIDK